MIYVKIADLFSDKILSGEFQAKRCAQYPVHCLKL